MDPSPPPADQPAPPSAPSEGEMKAPALSNETDPEQDQFHKFKLVVDQSITHFAELITVQEGCFKTTKAHRDQMW